MYVANKLVQAEEVVVHPTRLQRARTTREFDAPCACAPRGIRVTPKVRAWSSNVLTASTFLRGPATLTSPWLHPLENDKTLRQSKGAWILQFICMLNNTCS